MRSKSSITEEPYSFQKKVYKRVAAGMVWEDPTLADWDPSELTGLFNCSFSRLAVPEPV